MSVNNNHPYGLESDAIIGSPPEAAYGNSVGTTRASIEQVTSNKAQDSIELPSRYNKIHSGKVRDTYDYPENPDYQIIVATDRVSTHDVVHKTAIPNKGVVLTQMSKFWFDLLNNDPRTSDIKTHLPYVAMELPDDFPPEHRERAMVVKKLIPLPVEAIVRGYLYGSVMKKSENPDEQGEYVRHGTVAGITVRPGMKKVGKFDEPIFSPSTKGAAGEHDVNMTGGLNQMIEHLKSWECPRVIPGVTEERDGKNKLSDAKAEEYTKYMQEKSILLYQVAQEHAQKRGITLGDTKFEWGLDSEGNVVLIDEVLTPDSSRYWESDTVMEGQEPKSFDKEEIRAHVMGQWKANGQEKEKPALELPPEVVAAAQKRYLDIQDRLTRAA